jgi:hypothetical protein
MFTEAHGTDNFVLSRRYTKMFQEFYGLVISLS